MTTPCDKENTGHLDCENGDECWCPAALSAMGRMSDTRRASASAATTTTPTTPSGTPTGSGTTGSLDAPTAASADKCGVSGGLEVPPKGHYYGDDCQPNGHGIYWTAEVKE